MKKTTTRFDPPDDTLFTSTSCDGRIRLSQTPNIDDQGAYQPKKVDAGRVAYMRSGLWAKSCRSRGYVEEPGSPIGDLGRWFRV